MTADTTTPDLAACPFCGGGELNHLPGQFVACMNVNCGGQVEMGSPWGGPEDVGIAFLVAAWNRRAPQVSTTPDLSDCSGGDSASGSPSGDHHWQPGDPTPKFGDIVENAWASERNPQRRGIFVRSFTRTGKMNPGLTWEITDGKGKFWTLGPRLGAEENRLTVCRSAAGEAPSLQGRVADARADQSIILEQGKEIERLRFVAASADLLIEETSKACDEAEARVIRLEEALKPFADAAAEFRPDDADTMRPATVQAIHFRNALAALTGDKE